VYPKTVVLIGMNPHADLEQLKLMLTGQCEETPCGLQVPKWAVKKLHLTVHTAPRDLHTILDWAKVADVIVPVLAYTEDTSVLSCTTLKSATPSTFSLTPVSQPYEPKGCPKL
jgi:hypothetical protein